MKTFKILVVASLVAMFLMIGCGDDAGDARCGEFCAKMSSLCTPEYSSTCSDECNGEIADYSEAQVQYILTCATAATDCNAILTCIN